MKKRLSHSICTLLALGSSAVLAESMTHVPKTADVSYKVAINPPIILKAGEPFRNPDEAGKSSQDAPTVLNIGYTAVQYKENIVILRTYNGKLVGPTMRVDPNETLYVNLANNLSKKDPHAVTNLHTHGLHVSPVGNQDNIFVTLDAGNKLSYAVEVPKDQRRGTQWFHPHVHGNTSFQVAQGMEGALIVNDDPATMPSSSKVKENILVVQSIPLGAPKTEVDEKMLVPKIRAAASGNNKSIMTINGQVTPKITMNQGEVQRWRFINATPFNSLKLTLGNIAWNEIALDGMYLGTVDTWPIGSALSMEPGNRTDVMVKAPDNCSAGCPSVNLLNGKEIIATVEFNHSGTPMPLPTSAEMQPLKTWNNIDTSKVENQTQNAEFQEDNCDVSSELCVDGKTFSMANPPRMLPLNKTQGWNVSSQTGDHVFHIHVNPFQTVRNGPNGMETVWLDTVLIPETATPANPVKVWTTYEAIHGESVFHCHILPHEDAGMMQAIDIAPIGK